MKFSHKVVAGALSVALMGSVLYTSSSNESDYVEIQNQVQFNNKKKVDLQAEKKEPIIQDAPPGQNSGGSSSSSSVQVKGNGKLIQDPSINVAGIPMYDGLSLPNEYTEFDLEAFRKSRPAPLSYIGDYSLGKGAPYEFITTEFTGPLSNPKTSNKYVRDHYSGMSGNGKLYLVDGRLNIVLPQMVLMSDEDRAKVEAMVPETNRYGHRSWLGSNIVGMREQDNQPSSAKEGTKVDLVLDDGKVIACTLADTKDIQYGLYHNSDYFDSRVTLGYAHWQGDKNRQNMRLCLLEINTLGNVRSPELITALGLEGRKISKIVRYKN